MNLGRQIELGRITWHFLRLSEVLRWGGNDNPRIRPSILYARSWSVLPQRYQFPGQQGTSRSVEKIFSVWTLIWTPTKPPLSADFDILWRDYRRHGQGNPKWWVGIRTRRIKNPTIRLRHKNNLVNFWRVPGTLLDEFDRWTLGSPDVVTRNEIDFTDVNGYVSIIYQQVKNIVNINVWAETIRRSSSAL